MTHRDLPELHDLFRLMLAPVSANRKIDMIISYDRGLDQNARNEIRKSFEENNLQKWFDLKFLDCEMSADESFYLRKSNEPFDRNKYPFGLKSGPNIQFFRTLRKGKLLSSTSGCVFLFETDITPLTNNWISIIEDELLTIGDFHVAGSTYNGKSVLPVELRSHVNGASIYNWNNSEFFEYLELWEDIVRIGCKFAPWHAYDTMPEWIRFNTGILEKESVATSSFFEIYQQMVKRVHSITNLSGSIEKKNPEIVQNHQIFGRVAVHARASFDLRKKWQQLEGMNQNSPSFTELAFDSDWQYPAITEQKAYQNIKRLSFCNGYKNIIYFAFPWATLIDKILHTPDEAVGLITELRLRKTHLKKYAKVVTVCQHVHLKEILDILQEIGITDVFWSHATKRDVRMDHSLRIRIFPFPLFPVQTVSDTYSNRVETWPDRKFLFSFIGSYAPRYYLTQSRNHIIEHLITHPRGLIIERREWHYNKVVYNHQIQGRLNHEAAHVDEQKSQQFRYSLANSTFSLCPSGSGPNSIRLWESLGSGSIPVILADTWVPPGNPRLWEIATVRCLETPEAIKAIPAQLEKIAADPSRITQMRHAMRQLWLLYGPQSFVTDVQEFLLAQGSPPPSGDGAHVTYPPGNATDARRFLLDWAGRLLLEPALACANINADSNLTQSFSRAKALLTDTQLSVHFDSVLKHALNHAPPMPGPTLLLGCVPKICLFGRHSHRTPLSYDPIRQRIGDRIDWVGTPEEADLVVTGFNLDLRDNAERLLPLATRKEGPRFAVISEEPLWDITWSGEFTGRDARINVAGGEINYAFLGHDTSSIYAFNQLPYFILTENHFAVRYASLMAAQTRRTPQEMLTHWQTAPLRAAFICEKRKGQIYTKAYTDQDVAALSAYRTDLAAMMQGENVLCMGKGWGTGIHRQDLPDWHLDKLAHLTGHCFLAGCYENVHQQVYITEKIFDAFAVGAVPAYWASPQHRVFDLVPEASMLNTYGLDVTASAKRLSEFNPDFAFAEAWLNTCGNLSNLFNDYSLIDSERNRVADAVMKEIDSLL